MQNALSVGKWHHFTFTWQGKTGEWKIYVDYKDIMKDINTRTFKSGQKLNGGGKFVIAQEQDSFGGGFDESQAFVGSISAVNMWDRILTLAEITEHASSCAPPEGNLVSWNKVLERVVEMKKSSLKKTSTCKAV
ncbi:predicted protein [Nematostella vectensis]|uniref:Pentaxin n=1 Tax=Nematostella vectensis TaxID=45351 RepID=A7T0V7_NEMVE|nr:predicted protein [Nematostella vectensis]|eukprot:XP_001622509.1 hypothetical protein NEMVEDRAFT_v1g140859 [Nematostella vectensis]